ncbi:MAG: putative metal-binding motif-containing protein [Candidatus Woesearchaeota archaeon]|nr:putative metal-binding motif-containing protein [Candidatus Woesearchaeota archaeon]
MKKITIIFAMILLLVINIVYAEVPTEKMPCSFYGTVSVNGNPAESTDVTAYVEGTANLTGTGRSGPPSGNYAIDADADGKNIFFKVKRLIVNEAAVACVGGSSMEFSLTATDADNDGYNFDDCDETNASINPGATEICNWIDDDCNDKIDDNLGSTTCGVGACQATVQNCVGGISQTCVPGTPANEICGNSIDEDCDGTDLACPSGGGGGGGGSGGKCKSEWNCTSWSECVNSVQTRACSLKYPTCDPKEAKPVESQSCEMPVSEEILASALNVPEPNQTEIPAENSLTGNTPSTGRKNLLTGLAIGNLFNVNANPIIGIILLILIAGLCIWLFFFIKRIKGKRKNNRFSDDFFNQ